MVKPKIQPSEESSPSSPSKTVRKPCSTMCIIIVILAAFVLGTAGGYLLGQKQIQSQYPLSPTINNLPLSTAIPTPDPTANWKTYTSSKTKFSFKYPSDWIYKEWESLTSGNIQYTQIELAKEEYMNPYPINQPHILVTITETTNKNLLSIYNNTQITDTLTIDGIKAEVRKHKQDTVDEKYIVFIKDDKTFEFNSRKSKEDPSQNSIFDQILSTFKFLE